MALAWIPIGGQPRGCVLVQGRTNAVLGIGRLAAGCMLQSMRAV